MTCFIGADVLALGVDETFRASAAIVVGLFGILLGLSRSKRTAA